ncbi:hypothetical protein Pla22_03040 [Rubripirellula amarantea]|uniref:Tetratricopeptide repeat protein n=2 Tax=Rubripirellula amarantea TaxID=2527999 RepID=A0A5C5WPS8_9BACT|nr:hypothetical protein Pla22_03040 [Rubripirellula amarantea]
MGGEFIFDDNTLLQNPSLRDFFGYEWFRIKHRPVVAATFAANFSFVGEEPLSFHVVNIAVHVASVGCLFFLIERSLLLYRPELPNVQAQIIGLIAAMIWGLHPLSTAAVVYIVQRSEAMASLFIMMTLFSWSKAFGRTSNEQLNVSHETSNSHVWWAIISIGTAYLAYGSKELSAGLCGIVMLYDRTFIAKAWRPMSSRWQWYLLLALPLAIGCYLLLPGMLSTDVGRNTVGFHLPGMTPWSYLMSQPFVFFQYLKLTFLPINQSLDYGWLPSKDWRVQAFGLLGWLLIICAAITLWRRSRGLVFCLVAAMIVLAPTSTIVPLQDIIFEHRMYFPLACFVAAFVSWLGLRSKYSCPINVDRPAFQSWHLVGLLFIPLSILSINRNMEWWSVQGMYENDVRNNPNNPRAIVAAAGAVEDDSVDPEPTLQSLRKAIKISNDRGYFYAGTDYKWTRYLADILFLTRRGNEAKPHYEAALKMSYDDLQRTEILFQLAMIASMDGRNAEAERLFQESLAGHPQIRKDVETVYAEHRRRLTVKETPVREVIP